ncbi:MAG: signal peptidase II [Spirochaetota bacterium]
MKKYIYTALIFMVSLFLDIITKYLVLINISEHERINIAGSFIQLTLVYNRGGLFGILQGYQNLFLIISIIVLIFIIIFFIYEKNKNMIFCTSMALITSGAVGNILDRVTGRKGVVDFIYIGSDNVFRWWAFNVADAVIVVGAFLLFIMFIEQEKKRKAAEKTGEKE